MANRRKRPSIQRKTPEQGRSRATVGAILDATARILIKDGYDALTTNRVAEKAGVSIGSLYQYFPNKEALLSELMRRHTLAVEEGLGAAQRMRSAPLADLVRGAVEQTVRAHLIDPALHRALSEAPPFGKLDWHADLNGRIAARIRAAFEARRSEIVAPDLGLAVYVVTQAAEAIIHNAATERLADLKSGAVTEEVTRMLVGYLAGVSPSRATKASSAGSSAASPRGRPALRSP